jgi:prepilin-type processing-associated H-X9-DG protein
VIYLGDAKHHWRIDLKSGTNYSWVVLLLPYLEEEPLYQQFDLERPVTRNPSDPQMSQPSLLLCPSENTLGRYFETLDPYSERVVRFGKANYAAFTSPFHTDSWFFPGAISLYGQKMGQISSGISGRLVFSEVRTREHPADERGAWALPWSGASLLAMDMHPACPVAIGNCRPYECQYGKSLRGDQHKGLLPAYAPWHGSIGYSQPPNGPHPDIVYECPEPEIAQLERMPCDDFESALYMSAAPRSSHIGGVNGAFLDGHVEFLADDIDEIVMALMISTNGDPTPPPQY